MLSSWRLTLSLAANIIVIVMICHEKRLADAAAAISQINEKLENATTTMPTLPLEVLYKSCGVNGSEQCVPYDLCNEGLAVGGQYYVDHARTLVDDECHYMEKCCEIEHTLALGRSSSSIRAPLRAAAYGCGYSTDTWHYIRPLSYKQQETKFAEFPWLLAIYAPLYRCSGALIAPTVAITAAHCVREFVAAAELPLITVRAGDWDASVALEPLASHERKVSEIITHARYANTTAHNIALLLLTDALTLQLLHIGAICLPTPATNFNYTQCYASGWLRHNFQHNVSANVLKKLPLLTLPSAQCAKKLQLERSERLLCATSTSNERCEYSCQHADMVPLVCTVGRGNKYFLAGLLARVAHCEGTQLFAVYTSMKHYRPWIDLKLRERNIDIRSYMG